MSTIQTVTGPISTSQLGQTLIHEHLVVGYAGWEADTLAPRMSRAEMKEKCVERILSMKEVGVSSMVDPCPSDLGRDIPLMVEVAQDTGFNLICATGLYKQSEGGTAYWHFKGQFEPVVDAMAEVFIHELTEGIGDTGVRPGVIKVATGPNEMTQYERNIFEAAAKASVETGAPIMTHTDQGTVGDIQQQILTEAGVPAHRIIIGHCCGTSDHEYHVALAEGGSYLGFDRFGLEPVHPDAQRVRSLVALLDRGAGDRIVVSHDSVWCWLGMPFSGQEVIDGLAAISYPTHFHENIIPQLLDAGVTQQQIDMLLVDNPRRFFDGDPLPDL